ncbi:LppU/SCO3897 family protein, partial [Streptomyces sp. URMC 129]|uniref:LppU/SCO3897 family protein n=1 Tax=Streptomyces sp. URMC 129 TaxID=3423407 RepID=UPI003F1B8302
GDVLRFRVGRPYDDTVPDPTLELYQSVVAGDCLNNWMISETDWVSDTPDVVPCDDDGAGVWVSQTSDTTSACPVDAGRSYLSYSAGYETVALCVTRQFEVGQCFLGMADGTANLMSWVDCAQGVPAPYSLTYNVTGVYSAPATVQGDECRQSAGDQNSYYWWTVDDNTVLLCAVVYNG